MLFRSRNRRSFFGTLRAALAPRKGFTRPARYIAKRLLRLSGAPHNLALGFCWGSFVSFTPFYGLHFLLAALFAWLTRGNMIAALFGTAIGNPVTFPIIASANLWLGNRMLGRSGQVQWNGFSWSDMTGNFMAIGNDIILPFLMGGAVFGTAVSIVLYGLAYEAIKAYQARRRARCRKAIRLGKPHGAKQPHAAK